MWLSMGLLFFSSLFPYATSLVSMYFTSRVVQGFYGIVVIATTVMMLLIYSSLAKDDTREATVKYMKKVRVSLLIDIGIKAVGTIIGVLFWPPLVSVGILAAALFYHDCKKKEYRLSKFQYYLILPRHTLTRYFVLHNAKNSSRRLACFFIITIIYYPYHYHYNYLTFDTINTYCIIGIDTKAPHRRHCTDGEEPLYF